MSRISTVWPVCLTCGVRLAVVLPAVFHLDWRQADRLHHLVCPFAPIRGAESPDGQREGQRGEEQRQQGAVTSGHFLQHDCVSTQKQPNEKWNGFSRCVSKNSCKSQTGSGDLSGAEDWGAFCDNTIEIENKVVGKREKWGEGISGIWEVERRTEGKIKSSLLER